MIRAEEDWAIAKECWELAQAGIRAATTNASVAQNGLFPAGEKAGEQIHRELKRIEKA